MRYTGPELASELKQWRDNGLVSHKCFVLGFSVSDLKHLGTFVWRQWTGRVAGGKQRVVKSHASTVFNGLNT